MDKPSNVVETVELVLIVAKEEYKEALMSVLGNEVIRVTVLTAPECSPRPRAQVAIHGWIEVSKKAESEDQVHSDET